MQDSRSPRAGSVRRWLALLATATALLVLAGCGDEGSDTAATTSGGGSSSSGSGDTATAGVAEAQRLLDAFAARPTRIPIDTPIGRAIPPGKEVAFVSCGGTTCAEAARVAQNAADVLGWRVKVHDTNGTPEGFQAALDQVVRDQPDGLIYQGIDQSTIQTQLKQLDRLGTVVAAQCVLDPVSELIDYTICTQDSADGWGEATAAWVVADSGGRADTVYVDVPDFKIFAPIGEGFRDVYERTCADCPLDTISISFSELAAGEAPNRIVSHLRSNPDVKYVALAYDGLSAGLPAALGAAGLDDVKYIGSSPDSSTLTNVRSGRQGATVLAPVHEFVFLEMDAIARKLAGEDVLPEPEFPYWLVTQETLPDAEGLFPVVEDVEAQFAELWGKSSS